MGVYHLTFWCVIFDSCKVKLGWQTETKNEHAELLKKIARAGVFLFPSREDKMFGNLLIWYQWHLNSLLFGEEWK